MEQPINSVSVTVYTPGGIRGYINFGFVDGEPLTAANVDRMVAELGYLANAPGVEPGEELETITHVIRRTQHNKSDGTQTPCIGLYYENPKLVFAKKAYLNTPDEIATFERLSGLKVNAMPNYPGQLPKRDDVDAASYIMPAKTPFKIRIVDGTYTDKETGEVKPSKDFAGFYDIGSTPAAQSTASGNGSQDSKVIQPEFTPDEMSWKRDVMDLTAFLYNDENMRYNEFEHTASIQKRMKDTSNMGINATMSVMSAVTVVLAYRATKDLRLTITEFPQALSGKSLAMFMKDFTDVRQGLREAWTRLVDHAMKKSQPQASGQ